MFFSELDALVESGGAHAVEEIRGDRDLSAGVDHPQSPATAIDQVARRQKTSPGEIHPYGRVMHMRQIVFNKNMGNRQFPQLSDRERIQVRRPNHKTAVIYRQSGNILLLERAVTGKDIQQKTRFFQSLAQSGDHLHRYGRLKLRRIVNKQCYLL